MTAVSVADTWTVSGANVDPNAPSESPMSTSTREGRSSVRAPDGIAESRNLGVVTRRVTESLRTSQAITRTRAVPGTSPSTSVPGGTWYPSGTATAATGSRATAESLDWKCSVRGAPVVVMARGVSTASCVAPITIVIGATQLAVLTPRAMTTTGAPLTLHFQSSDSAVARLPVAAVAVPLGYQVPPGTDVDGLVPGTALVRVIACDVLSDSVTLRVTTPKFLLSAIPSGARTDDRPSRVEVDIGDSLGAFGSTFAPLTVHVSATATAVIHPDSAYIHVPARTYATASVVTWASHGTARVVFTDSAGRYPPDTSGPVSVSFPPLFLSVVRDTIALGMRQRRSIDLGVDRTVTGAPLVVHVAVNDTTALIESPATLTMPVGSTGGPPLVFTARH